MMKRLLLASLLMLSGSLLFTACKKQKQTPQNYLPGRLLIGLKGDTPVESAFAFANSEHFTILSVSNYSYISPYPKDSLASLSAYLLNGKPYINKVIEDCIYNGNEYNIPGLASVQFDSVNNKIVVSCTLEIMDNTNQADWIATKQQLQLTESDSTIAKMLYVKVPVGQEQAIINALQNNPMVIWAETNNIMTMGPY